MSAAQRCPNCPDAERRLVFEDAGGRVVRCERCGLQFAERYPDLEAAEHEIYPDGYFEKAIAEAARRAAIYHELLAELEGRLGRKGRLLDVGCGEGALIRVALERGWQAEGTEIASAAIEFMRRTLPAPVHEGELDRLVLPEGAFDAVVLNHVLEHVRDPGATLRTVARLLAPGGLVRIEVPNVGSLSSELKNLQSRLGMKRTPWKHYSTGHHFWFFTPPTLRHTLETAGLAVESLTAPARQWGRKGATTRALNTLYRVLPWGGHLVAYARGPR